MAGKTSARVRVPADLVAGLCVAAFGLALVWIGADYPMGRAARVGPGYLPRLLGLVMAGLGAVLMVRAFFNREAADLLIAWRPLMAILGSLVAFAVVLPLAGLIAAIAASVFIASFAIPKPSFVEAAVLAVVLALFCAVLFVWALKLPIPLIPR